jgi:hypothetical protein
MSRMHVEEGKVNEEQHSHSPSIQDTTTCPVTKDRGMNINAYSEEKKWWIALPRTMNSFFLKQKETISN